MIDNSKKGFHCSNFYIFHLGVVMSKIMGKSKSSSNDSMSEAYGSSIAMDCLFLISPLKN
jgi:hypothetical protein